MRSASLLLAAASLGVMALALVNSYRYVEKENWRQAVAWVRGSERDGDGIFFIHYGMQVPFDRYYRGALDRNGLPADFDWADGYYKRNVFNALDVPTSLAPRAARYQRLWLVLSHDGGRGSDVAIAFLDRAWRRADTREWTGVRVLLYERPSARSSLPARDS